MCLAVPAKIIEIENQTHALCDFNGIQKTVDVSLITEPQVGDWVIVHVGFALNKIDETKAQETLSLMSELASQNAPASAQ